MGNQGTTADAAEVERALRLSRCNGREVLGEKLGRIKDGGVRVESKGVCAADKL
jgi:hypothetical protein